MAKKQSIVSGKSIQDILNMDLETFNKLNESDFRKVVGRLVSVGNKRLRSFENAGESSPATRHVEKSGGVFSTRGKNLNALRAEYVRAKNFLESKTGTRKGWTKAKKEVIAGLKKHGVNMQEEHFNTAWKIYEELKEVSPEISSKHLKYLVLKAIADKIIETDKSPDEIVLQMQKELSKIYEEQAELDDTGVSSFFEIE